MNAKEKKKQAEYIKKLKANLAQVNADIGRGKDRTTWYDGANEIYQNSYPKKQLSDRVFTLMVTGHYISKDNLLLAMETLKKGEEILELRANSLATLGV
jgi:hypothetical protein